MNQINRRITQIRVKKSALNKLFMESPQGLEVMLSQVGYRTDRISKWRSNRMKKTVTAIFDRYTWRREWSRRNNNEGKE